MKTRTLAAFVIGLTAAGFASAQEVSLRATVPFSFVVGNKTLPAGEYRVSETASLGAIIIKGAGVSAVSLTIPAVDQKSGPKIARMVFRGCGDRYYLSQVWGGDKSGTEVPMTCSERELTARKHNSNQAAVAALREVSLHQ